MTDEPHDHGWRAHLDLAHAASRCGARRKRDGKPCCQPAMPNGRCRVHGGLSTGPRTPEGLERSRRSNWKHGYYSAKAKRVRRDARQQYRLLRQLIAAGNMGVLAFVGAFLVGTLVAGHVQQATSSPASRAGCS